MQVVVEFLKAKESLTELQGAKPLSVARPVEKERHRELEEESKGEGRDLD
jgi:hypothetical protein